MFKKRQGIKLHYNEQGLIYFICLNYSVMPFHIQTLIHEVCREVSGEYADALFTMLTDDTKNVHAVARRYYISESQLYFYRQKFYYAFAKSIKELFAS
jgi:hypothetical protein